MSMKLYRNILLALSLLILAAVIVLSNPAQIYSALAGSRAEFVLLALIITTFTAFARVFKWAFLLNARFLSLVTVQFLGTSVSILTPGRVAEPTKALLLKVRDGMPVSKSLPSIIWERVLDISVLVIFAISALAVIASTRFFVLVYIGVALFAVVIFLFLLILYSERFGYAVFNRIILKLPLLKNLGRGFVKSFYSVRVRKGRITPAFLLAVIIWLFDGIALYFVLLAFGVYITPFTAVGIVALSTMIGVASSLPGGIGSTEIVMIILLNAYGIQNPAAVTSVLIYRFVTLWYGLFLGFVSFVYLSKKINMEEIKLVK